MKTALALGTFDGVHKGHAQVLNLPSSLKKTAVVFALPPKAILSGQSSSIMTADDKFKAIKRLGIDDIHPLDFLEIKDMSPQSFLELLKEKLSPAYISCGFNYRFGKNAEGDTELLGDFCRKNGIEFKCHTPICEGNEPISSTRIRRLLANGEIKRANELLTEPFSFSAPVITGDMRGRTIGFPTVNQKYPTELIPLRFGVYKTEIDIDGEIYKGITDIGVRPTFKTEYIISETHIIGFSGDLYGRVLRLKPLHFIRDEVKFSSLDELKGQINRDINS